jgi:lipopolysaccharide/colanic/teichoic acid biosynthesis glycosyltransferase
LFVDKCAAATVLAMVSPVIAVIGVIVLLNDGRPVFYKQARVGKNGRLFLILKFRSMRPERGARISASSDNRITRLGKILRRYKLDELPQLWNVVRGDMALVGPRPEVPDFVDMGTPTWMSVLSVKPGITDVATLAYRNEEQILAEVANPEEYYRNVILPKKLALNLQYLRKRSAWVDIRVLLLTAAFSLAPRLADARGVMRLVSEKGRT